MAVYVDDVRHAYGRMVMCHMWADSLDELLAMADRIGVQRKWLQRPPAASWVHFDISLGKKALAIQAGAVLTDKYGPSEHVAKLNAASSVPHQAEYGHHMLALIAAARSQVRG